MLAHIPPRFTDAPQCCFGIPLAVVHTVDTDHNDLAGREGESEDSVMYYERNTAHNAILVF
jgi:hypothetical protein